MRNNRRLATSQLLQLEQAIEGFRTPAVSEVAGGSGDPFRILVSCIISLRTKDGVTDAASARLFAKASTPQGVLALAPEEIEQLIFPAGFYRVKAKALRGISAALLSNHGGVVPKSRQALLRLPGVGRKTANLVLSEAFGMDAICVDVHVHRIANRLGWMTTKTPEATEQVLESLFDRRYWKGLNKTLVTFGQNICLPVSPKCSVCPINSSCPRRGVKRHR